MFSQIFICILVMGFSLPCYAQHHTDYRYPKEVKYCNFADPSLNENLETSKQQYGEPPVWPDDWRRFNHEERKKAVLEAWQNALSYLSGVNPKFS
jgi:hypothetical protein